MRSAYARRLTHADHICLARPSRSVEDAREPAGARQESPRQRGARARGRWAQQPSAFKLSGRTGSAKMESWIDWSQSVSFTVLKSFSKYTPE
eukprot:6174521-Pleurochrysis_carterae.AAC.8